MTEPIMQVTEEDRRAAWDAFFARPADLQHIEVLAPETVRESDITLEALGRVLASDRRRVMERATS